jgi:hypothetical protein
MKRLLFILLSIVPIIVSAQDYYWYDGVKILLERGNQEYIIYDDSLLLESDKEKLIESGNVSYPEMVNLKWGITKPNVLIEDLKHVLYRMPSYKNNEGDNIFVTHRLNVKLKSSNDLSVLQNLAKQYNVEIEKESTLPLWYILRCGLLSAFNALELANIFYETELFAASEPEFIGGIYPDNDVTAINHVINNQSKSTKRMFRNGMLIIESDGKTYNVMGVEVGK